MGTWLVRLPNGVKLLVLMSTDGVMLLCAVCAGLGLRLGRWNVGSEAFVPALVIAAIGLPILLRAGFYRSVTRFDDRASFEISAVAALFVSVLVLAIGLLPWVGFPHSLFVITGLLFLAGLRLSRGIARMIISAGYPSREGFRTVAIYGAGAAGRQLLAGLRESREFHPVAFLDDSPTLHGRRICGLPLFDPADPQLATRLRKADVGEILLAIPSLSQERRREIVLQLTRLPIRVRTVPPLPELLSGQARLRQLREIEVEDLLGREPVPPLPDLLGRCITGLSVLVTGAGGSIGSELCRQIIALKPRRLVMLDHSEHALYRADREIDELCRRNGIRIDRVTVLGSVLNSHLLEQLFVDHRVETVYHAAAYKHVPLVEYNVLAGVENNVLGTDTVARVAGRRQARHFVLISTDKAVRPTNVMGASKRYAEVIVQSVANDHPMTVYSIVRFGNVLASSGSVVPLFREQIASGGPVTVTDSRITRYFMTIREAVQLVMQAGALARGGEVFVLDMGEPMPIIDLAHKMIRLAGLSVRDEQNPSGDIEIAFTGLRPGEKLFEELLIGNCSESTQHPRIWRAIEPVPKLAELQEAQTELRAALHRRDSKAVTNNLQKLVHDFLPWAQAPQGRSAMHEPVVGEPTQAKKPVVPEEAHQEVSYVP